MFLCCLFTAPTNLHKHSLSTSTCTLRAHSALTPGNHRRGQLINGSHLAQHRTPFLLGTNSQLSLTAHTAHGNMLGASPGMRSSKLS